MTFKECVEAIRNEFPSKYFSVTYHYNEDVKRSQQIQTECIIYLDKGIYKTATTFDAAFQMIMGETGKSIQPLIDENKVNPYIFPKLEV
jgi:hypothetical protein